MVSLAATTTVAYWCNPIVKVVSLVHKSVWNQEARLVLYYITSLLQYIPLTVLFTAVLPAVFLAKSILILIRLAQTMFQ
jgi:hypothetical protein